MRTPDAVEIFINVDCLGEVRSSVNRQTPLGDAGWLMKICKEGPLWDIL